MVDKIGTVSLFVEDQDRALTFYTEKLGMEKRMDAPFGEAQRWLAVAPEGAETELILYKADEAWAHYAGVVGKPQALTLHTDDLEHAIAELRAKGVTITVEPTTENWGTFAMILDSEGNTLLVTQS